MNNPNDVVQNKHLDALAARIAGNISGVDFVGATASLGGASGFVPAPNAGDNEKFLRGDGQWALPTVEGGGSGGSSGGQIVLGTTPSTVNGAMWYAVDADDNPLIKMRYGDYTYSLDPTIDFNGARILKPTARDCYEIYAYNDTILANIPTSSVTLLAPEDTDDPSVMTWVDETYPEIAENEGKGISDLFWIDIPDAYKPKSFGWLKLPSSVFTSSPEQSMHPKVFVNGYEMNIAWEDEYLSYVKLTIFGVLAVMVDA